jgi:sugar/nucleoside kinase (ribokinase family)/ribosomal protein S18 acetylase RimI-like enzyme
VFVGEAVLDVTVWIPVFPVRGTDTVADAAALTPGGGFNVMAAAARQGVPVLFAGRHGAGMAGDTVRAAMAAEGIEVGREVDSSADTGFVVSMVQPDGERTFVTAPAALLSPPDPDAVPVAPRDVVVVSGYALLSAHGAVLARWVGGLERSVTVVADPGPLVAELPRPALEVVAARADWWSCNRREATVMTGVDDPVEAGVVLAARRAGGGVVVRDGAAGCVLVLRRPGSPEVRHLAAPVVEVADTTGAGDAHVGVFAAGLAWGRDPLDAAGRATVAAAISVTRRGPATAPASAELERWLAGAAAHLAGPDAAGPGAGAPRRAADLLVFSAAGPADVDELVELIQSAYRGEASRAGWTTEADLLDGVRTDADSLQAVIDEPRSILLVARRAGEDTGCRPGGGVTAGPVVACCHLRDDGGSAYFGLFAVRPGSQGGGIGRAVLAEAERRAVADWHARQMRMTVIRQRVDLIAWYERLGFARTGETEPFPYGDERFGVPKRPDLAFAVLTKSLG